MSGKSGILEFAIDWWFAPFAFFTLHLSGLFTTPIPTQPVILQVSKQGECSECNTTWNIYSNISIAQTSIFLQDSWLWEHHERWVHRQEHALLLNLLCPDRGWPGKKRTPTKMFIKTGQLMECCRCRRGTTGETTYMGLPTTSAGPPMSTVGRLFLWKLSINNSQLWEDILVKASRPNIVIIMS